MLDVDGLLDPSVTVVAARTPDGRAVGVGALRRLDPRNGELRSMHVADAARGSGVGRAIAEHLLQLARDDGLRRVRLETGTMDTFGPARALYARLGFTPDPTPVDDAAADVATNAIVAMSLAFEP